MLFSIYGMPLSVIFFTFINNLDLFIGRHTLNIHIIIKYISNFNLIGEIKMNSFNIILYPAVACAV